jgi:hypothetical protein
MAQHGCDSPLARHGVAAAVRLRGVRRVDVLASVLSYAPMASGDALAMLRWARM